MPLLKLCRHKINLAISGTTICLKGRLEDEKVCLPAPIPNPRNNLIKKVSTINRTVSAINRPTKFFLIKHKLIKYSCNYNSLNDHRLHCILKFII